MLMEKQTSSRLYAIDGLRGWAALVVYLFHISNLVCYVSKYPLLDNYFYHTPLQIFVDGVSAVLLFFVLSGFSLSYKFFKKNGDNQYLIEAAEFRYLRLLVPVFFTLFIPYFLVHFNLIPHTQFFVGAYTEKFSIFSMIKFSFYDLPFASISPVTNYNPVLWTIHVEFLASFVVFSFLALFGKSNFRFLVYLFLMRFFYLHEGLMGYLYLFFLGMLICDVYCLQQRAEQLTAFFKKGLEKTISNPQVRSLVFIALLIFTYRHLVVHNHRFYFTKSNYLFLFIFLIMVLYEPMLRSFFSSKFSQFLGRISYSLYLTHFPILCSLSCFCHVLLTKMGYSEATKSVSIFLITTVVSFYVAYLSTLYIEEMILPFVKRRFKKALAFRLRPQLPASAASL